MRPSPATLAIISLACAGLVASGIWVAGLREECSARWKDSGFSYEWRQGSCMVLAGSRWLPETSVRIHVRKPG